jgi:hypothetical protein
MVRHQHWQECCIRLDAPALHMRDHRRSATRTSMDSKLAATVRLVPFPTRSRTSSPFTGLSPSVRQAQERVSLVTTGSSQDCHRVWHAGCSTVWCEVRADRRLGGIQMGDNVSACSQQAGGSHCLGVARMTEKASSKTMRRACRERTGTVSSLRCLTRSARLLYLLG